MTLNGTELYSLLKTAHAFLNKNLTLINEMNVFPVPDGDTGINMTGTISGVSFLTETTHAGKLFDKFAQNSIMNSRGNSGAILSMFFKGAAAVVSEKESFNFEDIAIALRSGYNHACRAVQNPREGTILSVMRTCADTAESCYSDCTDIYRFFLTIYSEASKTLDQTPNMLDVLKKAGVIDSGGLGFCAILYGFLLALRTGNSFIPEWKYASGSKADFSQFKTEDIDMRYCVECIIEKEDSKLSPSELADSLKLLGNSLVFLDTDKVIKLHIHSDSPDKVFSLARQAGSILSSKQEDMQLQHTSLFTDDLLPLKRRKKYGFTAVSNASGFNEVFSDMNVDSIIYGGETMNPSAESIVHAINSVGAETVFVLPGNGNIFLVCNTAASLCSNVQVEIIPTTTIPQSIAALYAFNESLSTEENISKMMNAAQSVSTVLFTRAIRDAVSADTAIKKGQFFSIVDGKPICAASTIEECVDKMAGFFSNFDFGIVYYGNDASEEETNELIALINNKNPELELGIAKGGQPLYRFIISLENA